MHPPSTQSQAQRSCPPFSHSLSSIHSHSKASTSVSSPRWSLSISLSSSSMLLVLLFRRRGIEARKKFVAPVGAWYSQVGRLHQVHHMWQYP